MKKPQQIPLFLILILLVSWGLMTINLNLPWWEQGGDNGAWISATVRNYDREGALNVGLLQILNYEPTTPEKYTVYAHHPPIIVWQTAIARQLFGFHEMSFRYVAAVMTLISTVGMYVLLRRLTHNTTQTLWGTALYAFTPMMLFYGRMPNHEAPALAFILLLLPVIVNLSRRITRFQLILMVIFTVLCAWTAWAALIFVGFAGLWLLWTNPHRHWKVFLGLALTAFLAVIVLIGYYQSQYPNTIHALLEAFVFRTSNRELDRGSTAFTLFEFIWGNLAHIILLFTPSLLILSAIGCFTSYQRANRQSQAMILALLVSALTYFLVFRNATYIHNYYKIYLAPVFAMLASYAMVTYQAYFERKRRLLMAMTQGLVLGGLITGGFAFALFHQSAYRPQLDEIRDLLAEYTEAGDRIYSNIDYGRNPLSFYASAPLTINTIPQQILTLASDNSSFSYVYCDINGDNSEFVSPDSLVDYEYIESETCLYYEF